MIIATIWGVSACVESEGNFAKLVLAFQFYIGFQRSNSGLQVCPANAFTF